MDASRPDPAARAQADPAAALRGTSLATRLALGFGAIALLLLALSCVAWLALQVPAAQLAPYRLALIGLATLGLGSVVALGLTVHRSLTLVLGALAVVRSQPVSGAEPAQAGGPKVRVDAALAGATPHAAAGAAAGQPIAAGEAVDDELLRLQRSVAAMQEQLRSVVKSVRIGTLAPAAALPPSTPGTGTSGGTSGVNSGVTPDPAAAGLAAGYERPAQARPQPEPRLDQLPDPTRSLTKSALAAGAPVPLPPWAPASLSAAELGVSASTGAEVSLQQAVEAARRGGEVVSQVVGHLDEITSASRRIVDIVATIDNITFQTNLLALNAALEAASNGGSVVGVAAEVRTLADRAATAAREIKGLISDAMHKIESGSQLKRDAGHTMDAIVTSVQCVTDIVGHLQQMAQRGKAAAGVAGAGPLAVEMSVEQLDRMTLQNVLLANKSSATAQSLQVQAERLQKVVAAFRLLQHTQEAAWTAHSAIAGARRSSLHGLGAVRFGQAGVPGLRNSSSED